MSGCPHVKVEVYNRDVSQRKERSSGSAVNFVSYTHVSEKNKSSRNMFGFCIIQKFDFELQV
jgi:hypothetical protein